MRNHLVSQEEKLNYFENKWGINKMVAEEVIGKILESTYYQFIKLRISTT